MYLTNFLRCPPVVHAEQGEVVSELAVVRVEAMIRIGEGGKELGTPFQRVEEREDILRCLCAIARIEDVGSAHHKSSYTLPYLPIIPA